MDKNSKTILQPSQIQGWHDFDAVVAVRGCVMRHCAVVAARADIVKRLPAPWCTAMRRVDRLDFGDAGASVQALAALCGAMRVHSSVDARTVQASLEALNSSKLKLRAAQKGLERSCAGGPKRFPPPDSPD